MRTYKLPDFWYDKEWEENRDTLLALFNRQADILLRFEDCQWIDLLPLVDLLLQITSFCHRGGRVALRLGRNRASRFLLESGFLESLSQSFKSSHGLISIQLGSERWNISNFFEEVDQRSFPRRVLDFDTLVPCTVLEAGSYDEREAVFQLSRSLHERYLEAQRVRGLRVPIPLLYEIDSFFQSALPELIDNVRLHKREQKPNFFALYMRLRRRDERLYGARKYAEPAWQLLTEMKRRTMELWQNDIIEAIFIDTGLTIQETWIRGWLRTHDHVTEAVPRLPSGIRVDGPNADCIILEGVFKENASSFSKEERELQNLPLRLTGLHSLKQTIHGSQWSFSVRSGENTVLIHSGGDNAVPPVVKQVARHSKSPGVGYFFRFASNTGRPLSDWLDLTESTNLAQASAWWRDDYPERFRRCYVVDDYTLPAPAEERKVVICRPDHFIGKHRLYDFLLTAERRRINVVFADLAAPIALRLYLLIEELGKEAVAFRDLYPIITNSLHLLIPGTEGTRALQSFAEGKGGDKAWWKLQTSPIRSAREVYLRCRQHDSKEFWRRAAVSPSFLTELVQWSRDLTLTGGYVFFHSAIRDKSLRRLIRRRLVTLLQALRVRDVLPTTDSLRHFVADVKRNCILIDNEDAPIALLGSVLVTGQSFKSIRETTNRYVTVPIFIYPDVCVIDHTSNGRGVETRNQQIYVLDWTPDVRLDFESPELNKGMFMRLGSTDQIIKKPSSLIEYRSLRRPEHAYREWQALSLINIGHYSYQKHHFFVTLDLVSFIYSNTPAANDMALAMATRVAEINPVAVFYFAHEAGEALIDRLVNTSEAFQILNFPSDRLIPVTSANDIRNRVEHLPAGKIALIDDASVTGKTIQEARAKISSVPGYELYTFVVLDRTDTGFDATDGRHFAWWSLAIPPLGESDRCAICRGLDRVRSVARSTNSSSLRQLLERWCIHWDMETYWPATATTLNT